MGSNLDMDAAFSGCDKALTGTPAYRDMTIRIRSRRVHELSLMIGRDCGMDARQLAVLSMASSFHDIGKIGVPDKILKKPSGLDEVEWRNIRKHSEFGEHMLLSSGFRGHPINGAAEAIRHHHEHYDGSGYPDCLAGEAIPLASRIIAIADSYDAMAVTRAYRTAMTHSEIMAVMDEETGTKFEPQLMRMFSERIGHSAMRAV